MPDTPESDEVAAHLYRRAQANRMLRFCRENSITVRTTQDLEDALARLDLTPIQGPDGKVQPEAIDFDSVR